MTHTFNQIEAQVQNRIINRIISDYGYRGILEIDGFETVELTIRRNHNQKIADRIIAKLQDENN